MSSLRRQTLQSTVLTYAGIALGFVNVVLLYPKVLRSDEFGLTRLLVSLAGMAAMVAQLGSENTVVRYFPYFRDPARGHRGVLGMLLVFATVVGLGAVSLLAVFHGYLTEVFADRNALYGRYGLFILPLVFSEVFFILLRSYSRSLLRAVQPIFIREFILRLLQTALIMFQSVAHLAFGSFMVLYTGTFLLCTVLLVLDLHRNGHFKLGWSQRWFPRRLRRSVAWYSFFTLSASLAGMALGNLDQLMVGALLGDGLRYVAHYSVGFYFGTAIATPARAMLQVALPLVADAWKRGDRVLINDLYKRSSLVQTIVSGYFYLLLWTNIDDLFALLPAEYAGAADVALLVGAAFLLVSTVGLSTGIISMSRAYRFDAWTSLGVLIVAGVANFFLIRHYGMVGAAWATLFSLLVYTVYRTAYLMRRFHLSPFSGGMVKAIMLLAGVALVARWIPVFDGLWVDLVLRSLIVSVLFWPAAHLLGLTSELKPLVQRLVERTR